MKTKSHTLITRKRILHCVGILLFILILIKCNQFTRVDLISTKGQSYERAIVTDITHDNLAENGSRYGNQEVTVLLKSGSLKGTKLSAVSPSGQLFGATCHKGMHVIAIVSASNGTHVATVYSQNRIASILAFLGVFVAAVCLVGRKKGIMTLISLAFIFVAILYLMFPAIYRGASPVLMAIIICALTSLVTLGLLNGFSSKTAGAMAGTSCGVAIAGAAALIFGHFSGISGYNVPEIETLNYVSQYTSIHIGQLLFAGIIISSLGAVMDVGMSISSSIQEVHTANPSLGQRELFASGMHVGRDLMGTDSNTLILAFAGGSLTTLLIDYAYKLSFLQLINSYNIGIEIMQGLSGTLGIILTIPVTSLISSLLIFRETPPLQ